MDCRLRGNDSGLFDLGAKLFKFKFKLKLKLKLKLKFQIKQSVKLLANER